VPTYDYLCDACGHALEIFQSMTEAAKRKCPECGKLKLRRRIGTGGGILFKGSGFYQTDYRSDSYKSAAKADKPSEPAKPAAEKKPD
jgi:putative FmdB family regulatory protein